MAIMSGVKDGGQVLVTGSFRANVFKNVILSNEDVRTDELLGERHLL